MHSACNNLRAEEAMIVIKLISETFHCEECRDHMKKFMLSHPPRGNLFEWSVKFHNSVNLRTGKREISVAEAKKALTSECPSCTVARRDTVLPTVTPTTRGHVYRS